MLANLIFCCAYLYFLIIIKTSRAKLIGREAIEKNFIQGKQLILCCPHNFLLALFTGIESANLQRQKVTILASLSKDGTLISKLLTKFNFEIVRGSSNNGARSALRALRSAVKRGNSIGLAFDGPKGPPLIPKKGIIGCIRASTNMPKTYLIYGKVTNRIRFIKPFRVNSWDKFLIPLPFSDIEIVFEELPDIQIDAKQNISEKENFILNYIESRSKEKFGNLYGL